MSRTVSFRPPDTGGVVRWELCQLSTAEKSDRRARRAPLVAYSFSRSCVQRQWLLRSSVADALCRFSSMRCRSSGESCEWRVGRGPSGACAEEGVADGPVQVQEARDGQGEAGEGRGGSPHRGQIRYGGERAHRPVESRCPARSYSGSSSGEWRAECLKS